MDLEPHRADSGRITPLSVFQSLARLWRLVRKELSEILRDRRTIITLVLMPLLLYPLLSIGFQQFFLASQLNPNRGPDYCFGFVTKADAAFFHKYLLTDAPRLLDKSKLKDGDKEQGVTFLVDADLERTAREEKIDVGIIVTQRPDFESPVDETVKFEVIYVPESAMAHAALRYLQARVSEFNERELKSRMNLEGIHLAPVTYLQMAPKELETNGDVGLVSLSALIPLVLILMTITGAVYPAIDMTAGERERGTLEILMAAPVPRLGLLFAKYVSVVTVAVLTGIVNLVTMIATLYFSRLTQVLFGDQGMSLLLPFQLFGLLLLFALFFSAVLLSLTSFARSFKEAQAYLIPLMLASLGPGLVGMIPNLKLEGFLAVAPLVNIVLLGRDLLHGGVDLGTGMKVVLSTMLYAGAAIAVAARTFGAEGVLYNEQSGWSDLVRRPAKPQPEASVTIALWSLALMIPTYFVLIGTLSRVVPKSRPLQLIFFGCTSLLMFGLLPVTIAWFRRIRIATGFFLRVPKIITLPGAILLGLFIWTWLLPVLAFTHSEPTEELRQSGSRLIHQFKLDRQDYLGGFIVLLVFQALVEEFFFRGFLFRALEKVGGKWQTIVISALLFGFVHVVMGGPIGAERFIPTTLLGLILGWVAWTSGSVVPGMFLHAIHNGLLVGLGQDEIKGIVDISSSWQAIGLAATIAGVGMIWWGRAQREGGVASSRAILVTRVEPMVSVEP